jgi:His-Xaa-Ser system protein HxsD
MEAKHGRQEDHRNGDYDHTVIDGIEQASPSTIPSIWLTGSGQAILRVDTRIFSIDAILRAAYKFTGLHHIWLEQDMEGTRCVVCVRAKREGTDLSNVVGEFSNELVDQQLRERLERQFGGVRTLIAAQAFAEGNLLGASDQSE